jgi:CRISPR-associated protein Cas1
MTGVEDSSVSLRRAHFRAADLAGKCASVARQIIAGKLQNCRNSLLRAARENEDAAEQASIGQVVDTLGRQLHELGRWTMEALCADGALGILRGSEGLAGQQYFAVFKLLLKQQRESFNFTTRSRRPPRDRINCLLSFLYALVRHDCIAALTATGLDPFVGFLHTERPNRPALALDLMEEFRPWTADRLAVTLINRRQIGPEHFRVREGGAVEFTDPGRRAVIAAYQERKKELLQHPLLAQSLRIGQMPFIQARILARYLRGDLPEYLPLVPR